MKIIETENLLLRPFKRKDARDLYAYASTPQVGPLAGWPPHLSIAQSRKVIRAFKKQGTVLAICQKSEGRVIGSIGLHPDEKRTEINSKMLGYALSPEYWGKGIVTEAAAAVIDSAFNDTDIVLLSAYCYSDNLRSKRVLEKCGFVYEGCMRMAYRLYDGSVHDSLCFSITRTEYERNFKHKEQNE